MAANEGGVVAKAQELTWEQVEKALPPLGMSACVDAHALVAGRVKEILANPLEVIKPKELWPKRAKKGRIMATEEEAKKICLGLVKRGILRIAEKEERIYDLEGNVIAAGLFGIGKGNEFEAVDGR